MELTKKELGQFLELLDNRNSLMKYGVEYVRGVNNLKQLMPTKADLSSRDLSKFQIVRPGEFVFNHRTSRNGSKFSIAYNDTEESIICTEDYVVFRIKPVFVSSSMQRAKLKFPPISLKASYFTIPNLWNVDVKLCNVLSIFSSLDVYAC